MLFDLKQIRTEIAEGKYINIGNGSGRSVYDLGNGFVAKYARNIRGTAQNAAEFEIYISSKSNIFAKIEKVAADYSILIMQKAEPIVDIKCLLDYFKVKSKEELAKVFEINRISIKYRLITADLCKSGSWGLINNIPVLIDYGYTRWVYKRFYYKQ